MRKSLLLLLLIMSTTIIHAQTMYTKYYKSATRSTANDEWVWSPVITDRITLVLSKKNLQVSNKAQTVLYFGAERPGVNDAKRKVHIISATDQDNRTCEAHFITNKDGSNSSVFIIYDNEIVAYTIDR